MVNQFEVSMSTRENTASGLPSQARNKKITLVVSVGLGLVTGAIQFGGAASQQSTPPAPTGSVMRVAAVGDIHGEEASSITAATAAEAAKADIILGLGDYQYPDGAMWQYNRYFDKDWGPNVPKRSEEHTSELQSQSNLVCRLLLEKKNNIELISTKALMLAANL